MAEDSFSGESWQEQNAHSARQSKIIIFLVGLLALFLAFLIPSVFSNSGVQAESAVVEPCSNSQVLLQAVSRFLEIKEEPMLGDVYGEGFPNVSNPPSKFLSLIKTENVAAIENPMGEGVIVSVNYSGGKALHWDTLRKTSWLVLDGVLYPIDVEAATSFRLRYDGFPEKIMARAGLSDTAFGLGYFGFTDFASYNSDRLSIYDEFLAEANALCETPQPL